MARKIMTKRGPRCVGKKGKFVKNSACGLKKGSRRRRHRK